MAESSFEKNMSSEDSGHSWPLFDSLENVHVYNDHCSSNFPAISRTLMLNFSQKPFNPLTAFIATLSQWCQLVSMHCIVVLTHTHTHNPTLNWKVVCNNCHQWTIIKQKASSPRQTTKATQYLYLNREIIDYKQSSFFPPFKSKQLIIRKIKYCLAVQSFQMCPWLIIINQQKMFCSCMGIFIILHQALNAEWKKKKKTR